MNDLSSDQRLQELLLAAERARSLKQDFVQKGEGWAEVEEALDGIYRDIGKHVYSLTRASEQADEADRAAAPELPPDDDNDNEGLGSWYTEEVEIEGADSSPLFQPGDLLDDEFTDVPEVDYFTNIGELTEADGDEFSTNVARVVAELQNRDSDIFAMTVAPPPVWAHKLWEFIDMLGPINELTSAEVISNEATRVQWGCNELDARLSRFPPIVQCALIGLLSARAQNLRARISVDVGPKLALDRLRRYRVEQDLPTLAGLAAQPRPEYGTWENDVKQWTALLRTGSDTDT